MQGCLQQLLGKHSYFESPQKWIKMEEMSLRSGTQSRKSEKALKDTQQITT